MINCWVDNAGMPKYYPVNVKTLHDKNSWNAIKILEKRKRRLVVGNNVFSRLCRFYEKSAINFHLPDTNWPSWISFRKLYIWVVTCMYVLFGKGQKPLENLLMWTQESGTRKYVWWRPRWPSQICFADVDKRSSKYQVHRNILLWDMKYYTVLFCF